MEEITITADYHTHTTYSHGRGSVRDNVASAAAAGLSRVAITDHAVNHPLVGVRRQTFPKIRRDVTAAAAEVGIDVWMGMEGNIVGTHGEIDLTPEDTAQLDVVLVGFHLTAYQRHLSDYFKLVWNGVTRYALPSTKGQIARNTDAFVQAIYKNDIDILTHIGFRLDVDYAAIGRACAETGTYVELSSRHRTPDDDSIGALLDAGVNFVVNSDAHRPENIGKYDFALDLIARRGIPAERIGNCNGKELTLRSKKNKA